jgi:multidrug efflux pump subunit AcrB
LPLVAEGKGLILLYLRAPSGLRLEPTDKRVAEVERFLEQNLPAAERRSIVSEIGVQVDRSAASSQNSGEQDATIHVALSTESKLTSVEQVVRLRKLFNKEVKFADLRARLGSDGQDASIVVHVLGNRPADQEKLAHELRNRVTRIKGTADVDVAQRTDAPQLLIEVDRRKAAQLGLSAQEVITQVVGALNPGASGSSDFWIDQGTGEQHAIEIRHPEDLKLKVEDTLNVPVKTSQGGGPRLSSLATLRRVTTAVEIDHINLRRVFSVRVNVEGRNRGDVLAEIEKVLKEVRAPAGINLDVEEESRKGQ